MSTERILKALAVTDQGLSDAEKAQCRENIGAQGALTAGPNIDIYNDIISTEKPRVEAGTNVSVNSVLDPQTRVITYTVSATDTTYNVFNTTTDGLVPKASGTGDTDKFLKGDGTWEAISTSVSATAPLHGTGTQADPLHLLVSHGLSVVQPAGGDTYLQVTHPVPAPGSTSAGKVLTCNDALGNLSWQDAAPSPVYGTDFGQTYGTPGTVTWTHDDASSPHFNKKLLDLNLPSAGWYLVNINGVGHFAVSGGSVTTSGLLKFRICTGNETAAINSQDGVFQIGISGTDNYGFYATVLVQVNSSNYSTATVNISNNDYQPISGVTESFVSPELRITWQKVGSSQ